MACLQVALTKCVHVSWEGDPRSVIPPEMDFQVVPVLADGMALHPAIFGVRFPKVVAPTRILKDAVGQRLNARAATAPLLGFAMGATGMCGIRMRMDCRCVLEFSYNAAF